MSEIFNDNVDLTVLYTRNRNSIDWIYGNVKYNYIDLCDWTTKKLANIVVCWHINTQRSQRASYLRPWTWNCWQFTLINFCLVIFTDLKSCNTNGVINRTSITKDKVHFSFTTDCASVWTTLNSHATETYIHGIWNDVYCLIIFFIAEQAEKTGKHVGRWIYSLPGNFLNSSRMTSMPLFWIFWYWPSLTLTIKNKHYLEQDMIINKFRRSNISLKKTINCLATRTKI